MEKNRIFFLEMLVQKHPESNIRANVHYSYVPHPTPMLIPLPPKQSASQRGTDTFHTNLILTHPSTSQTNCPMERDGYTFYPNPQHYSSLYPPNKAPPERDCYIIFPLRVIAIVIAIVIQL